jgi:hypothetical protein
MQKQAIPKKAYNYNQQSGSIDFINGSQILLKDLFFYPSDPDFDELGSLEINGGYIDEASQVTEKAKNILKSRCGRWKPEIYTFTPKLLMTCNPSKGWLYNQFYKPSKDGTLPSNKRFIQALYSDNSNLSSHYIQNLDELDTVSRARLKLGDWEYDNDPSKLIDYNSILDSFSNEFVQEGKKYITADIARFGKDKTVIGYWNGMRCEEIIVMATSSIPESASVISDLRMRRGVQLSNVIVDEQGLGGGVKDLLRCEGFVSNTRARGNFSNLKSECYFELAKTINENRMYIFASDKVKELICQELEVIKSETLDKDGKLSVINKDKMKEILNRSPDFADMLMMRMYFEVRIISYF